MENPIKMDDLGGKPTIFGNTQIDKFHVSALKKHGKRHRWNSVISTRWLKVKDRQRPPTFPTSAPREASDKGGLVQGLKLIGKLSVLEIRNWTYNIYMHFWYNSVCFFFGTWKFRWCKALGWKGPTQGFLAATGIDYSESTLENMGDREMQALEAGTNWFAENEKWRWSAMFSHVFPQTTGTCRRLGVPKQPDSSLPDTPSPLKAKPTRSPAGSGPRLPLFLY